MAMAVSMRTLTTLGVTVGAGVLAGAGQLGVGYGLGILRWDREFTGDTWHTQLAWVAFLAAVAVICGAVAGRARAAGAASRPGQRAALVAAAALGSLVVLPLVVRPAGASHLAESGDPRLIAAITAGAGLALGVIAAVAVLSVPVVSGNIVSCVVWVWLAGMLSAVVTLGRGASWGTARLGLLPATGLWVPVALFGAAIVIAAVVAGVARLGGNDPRSIGVSGAAGPALVGAAYLVAGPGTGVAAQAYRYALIAVVAGAVVSVLLAVLRRRPAITMLPRGGDGPTAVEPWESATAAHTPDYGWPEAPAPAQATFSTPPPTPALPAPVEPPPPAPSSISTPTPSVSLPRVPARATRTAPEPVAPEPKAEPVAPEARAEPVAPEPRAEPEIPTGTSGTAPRRKGFPVRRRGRTTAPEPAGDSAPPPPPASPSIPRPRAEEPEGVPVEPTAKQGRRSRRRAEDSRPAPESDYVDWVKGLSGGADGGVRVGGTARHAKPGDRPTDG